MYGDSISIPYAKNGLNLTPAEREEYGVNCFRVADEKVELEQDSSDEEDDMTEVEESPPVPVPIFRNIVYDRYKYCRNVSVFLIAKQTMIGVNHLIPLQ